jgi:hypothetical protein
MCWLPVSITSPLVLGCVRKWRVACWSGGIFLPVCRSRGRVCEFRDSRFIVTKAIGERCAPWAGLLGQLVIGGFRWVYLTR